MGGDKRLNVEEFSLADSPHEHQVLNAAEGPVLRTMLNDSLSDNSAYAGKRFQLIGRGDVDVDSATVNC